MFLEMQIVIMMLILHSWQTALTHTHYQRVEEFEGSFPRIHTAIFNRNVNLCIALSESDVSEYYWNSIAREWESGNCTINSPLVKFLRIDVNAYVLPS